MQDAVDCFIIGAGINGMAIAADAAGRGLSVIACDKGDIAGATSSASSKLIHGGLRYLELYDFKLVRTALTEREILLKRAPHLVTPLEFILPHTSQLRPVWLLRLGLFLYDFLAKGSTLPRSHHCFFKESAFGTALQSSITQGFSYFDCHTDDARLTLTNALAAKAKGAKIFTYCEFLQAERRDNYWEIQVKNSESNKVITFYAKCLINAAGPWIKTVQNHLPTTTESYDVELVQGSHIIVPKLYDGNFAYILQNIDKRIVFVIPFDNNYTYIGTTDVVFKGDINHVHCTPEEEDYLCAVMNRYFKRAINRFEIVNSWAGVRTLQAQSFENPRTITREQKLIIDHTAHLPLITILGGKLTTHRALADDVLTLLKPYFPQMGPSWTSCTPLPGGEFAPQSFEKFYQDLSVEYSFLPKELLLRYARNYGTRCTILLKNIRTLLDLGESFGPGLYQREIEYLIQEEWANTAEDILWRRTKLGLYCNEAQIKKLRETLARYPKNNGVL